MAVVVTPRDSSADNVHERGTGIRVADGHLYVVNDDSTALAVYAPGYWAHAETN